MRLGLSDVMGVLKIHGSLRLDLEWAGYNINDASTTYR